MIEGETFTEFEVEAAMCLWESVIYYIRQDSPVGQTLLAVLAGCGSADIRMRMRDLAKECVVEFDKVAENFNGCFDWDFCPAFIHRKVEEGFFD